MNFFILELTSRSYEEEETSGWKRLARRKDMVVDGVSGGGGV